MNAFTQFGGADEEHAATLRSGRQFQPLRVHAIGHYGTSSAREAEVCLQIVPHRSRWTDGTVGVREKCCLIQKFLANTVRVGLWWLPIGKRATFGGNDALSAEQNVNLGNDSESAPFGLYEQGAALAQHREHVGSTAETALDHGVTQVSAPTQMFAEPARRRGAGKRQPAGVAQAGGQECRSAGPEAFRQPPAGQSAQRAI